MDDDLMTPDEVSELARIPKGTLAYWRHVGAGPKCGKLGRRVLYRRADVAAWIAMGFKSDDPDAA